MEERESEQIEAKKRKTCNHSVGFHSILPPPLFVLIGKEKDGWQGVVTRVEFFSDLSNSVFGVDSRGKDTG